MCKAPKPQAPKEPKKPMFLRNKYLDEFIGDSAAVKSLKTGRATLRIPAGSPTPIGGRQPGQAITAPPAMVGPEQGAPPTSGSNPGADLARRIGPRPIRLF